ncbi:MAG: flagellar export protein FliJ [bacterium]
MSRFSFRLQKVLDLKERSAQRAAAQLVVAKGRADEAREAHDQLAAIRDAGGAQLAQAHTGNTTAGQLQNISFLLEKLDQHVDYAAGEAQTAEHTVASAQSELTLAHQAKRALDRLRERQLGDWQHALSHADRQNMDSLALALFSRNTSIHADDSK